MIYKMGKVQMVSRRIFMHSVNFVLGAYLSKGGLGQVLVAIEWWIFMQWHFQFGKIRFPFRARGFISEIFHIKLHVFFAAAAQQIQAIDIAWVIRKQHSVFTQALLKQIGIQLSVTEMIGIVQVGSERGHAIYNFPESGMQLGVIELIGRRY